MRRTAIGGEAVSSDSVPGNMAVWHDGCEPAWGWAAGYSCPGHPGEMARWEGCHIRAAQANRYLFACHVAGIHGFHLADGDGHCDHALSHTLEADYSRPDVVVRACCLHSCRPTYLVGLKIFSNELAWAYMPGRPIAEG